MSDAVSWHRMHGTHGHATAVPEYLRDLRSPDPVVHEDAFARLSDVVYHQGTRWQASAHVVPFVVSLIDDASTPRREDLVRLLHAIAVGDRMDDELPFRPDRVFAAARNLTGEQVDAVINRIYHCDDDDADLLTELADRVAVLWEAEAYAAAGRHTEACVRWLADPDRQLASRAAALLAWFTPTVDIVAALLTVPVTAHVRASANLALARLPHADPGVDDRLCELSADDDAAIALTASVALAHRIGEALPDRVLDILVQARETGHPPDTPPGWDRSMAGFVARALQSLGLG